MDRVQILWDDEYIYEHWEEYRNWLSLSNAYNRDHGTNIGYNTFKSHCYRMGLNFRYSHEQEAWLKDNYPVLGYAETAKRFNARFSTSRTSAAIKVKCKKMGLKVSESRRKARGVENTHMFVYPVGSVVIKQHGEPYIKTENGYRRLKEQVYGKVPSGKVLIHLNGDQADCDINNLYPVSRAVLARMTANDLWSKDRTITKTGCICCELEDLLCKS